MKTSIIIGVFICILSFPAHRCRTIASCSNYLIITRCNRAIAVVQNPDSPNYFSRIFKIIFK